MARRPILLEIQARSWLGDLARRAGRPVTLAEVPDSEIAGWTSAGFTHVWLMGVWTTGPRARQCFLDLPGTRERLSKLLPDWTGADVSGSPYSVAEYRVPGELGGDAGLLAFRERLNASGVGLILDFIPNHVGLDHAWVTQRPDWLVNALRPREGTFWQQTVAGVRWIAHGRDPNFPPWVDTAQVDLRKRGLRAALVELLKRVAEMCDGVRCDMAMLGLSGVFQRTWVDFPVNDPVRTEFWAEAIASVRRPGFIFLAEAYWDLEERLLELGFDYAYDKRVLDHVVDRRPDRLSAHLGRRGDTLVTRGVHFLENHDEPRIAPRLSLPELRLAALLTFGLPGLPLVHEGQLAGARVRASIHLSRRPSESEDPAVASIYRELLRALQRAQMAGVGRLLPVTSEPLEGIGSGAGAGAGLESGTGPVIVVFWPSAAGSGREFGLVVVNLGPGEARFGVVLPEDAVQAGAWTFVDLLDEGAGMQRVEVGRGVRLELDVAGQTGRLLRWVAAT